MDLLALALEGSCPPEDPAATRSRRMFALVPTTIILILSVLTYGLRLYCRKKTGQNIRSEDYLMGVGLLISIEPAICEYLCKRTPAQQPGCRAPDLPANLGQCSRTVSATTSVACRPIRDRDSPWYVSSCWARHERRAGEKLVSLTQASCMLRLALPCNEQTSRPWHASRYPSSSSISACFATTRSSEWPRTSTLPIPSAGPSPPGS